MYNDVFFKEAEGMSYERLEEWHAMLGQPIALLQLRKEVEAHMQKRNEEETVISIEELSCRLQNAPNMQLRCQLDIALLRKKVFG